MELESEDQRLTLQLADLIPSEPGAGMEEIRDETLRKEFLIGFGSGLAPHFDDLPPEHRETLWKLARENSDFAEGLMDGFKSLWNKSSQKDKRNFWLDFSWHPKQARMIGVVFGLGFSRVTGDSKEYLLGFAKKSPYFSEGFGFGSGLLYEKFPASDKDIIQDLQKTNEAFKKGFQESRNAK